MSEEDNSRYQIEIYKRQVALVYKQSLLTMVVLMIVICLMAYFVQHDVQNNIWYWFISFMTVSLIRYGVGIAFHKQELTNENVNKWYRLYHGGVALLGIHWFILVIFFFPEDIVHKNFVVFILSGTSAAAAVVYAPIKKIYYYFFLPLIVPLIYQFASVNDDLHIAMAIMIGLFMLMMLVTVKRVHEIYKDSISLSYKNQGLVDDLQLANVQILEATEAKSIFLANMSHEIRTPMNAIVGFTNLLQHSALNEKQGNYLDNIQLSARNLLVIINDILDLSKVEAGKMEVEEIAFDLHKLLYNVHATLEHRARAKHLELQMSIDKKSPKVVFGDPTRLNQVLINLTGNAIKFTEKGHVEMKIIAIDDTTVHFNILDSGIGIPKDRLDAIFEQYSQSDTDTTRKFGGTGLGLAISKKIVELCGGQLAVESELGTGSNFHFTINFKLGKESDIEIEEDVATMNTSWLRQIKILVVDDNKVNRLLAIEVFKSWDKKIDIDTAENGQLAIDKLLINHYDVILMDMQMPVMGGVEATKNIRKLEAESKREVKIIALTANALKKEQNKCFEAGMNGYMAKPFEPAKLLQKIANVLNREDDLSKPIETKEEVKEQPERVMAAPKEKARFDFEYLYESFGENEAVIKGVIDTILEEVPEQLALLHKALEVKDYQAIKYNAHSLVNKMIYINANDFVKVCRQIELLATEEYDYEVKETMKKHDFINQEFVAIAKELKKADP